MNILVCIWCIVLWIKQMDTQNIEMKAIAVLNAFDDDGVNGAIEFCDTLQRFNHTSSFYSIFLFSDSINIKHVSSECNLMKVLSYQSSSRLIDQSIGKVYRIKEKVSYIIESWRHIIKHFSNCRVISLSFQKSSIPVATNSFFKLLEIFTSNQYDIMMLGKVKKLTSPSDWHDLGIFAFDTSSKPFRNWFETFESIYLTHADRKFFTLLEPRPALLESLIQVNLRIGYFDKALVCSWKVNSENIKETHIYSESTCSSFQNASIEWYCRESQDNRLCHILNVPSHWKRQVDRSIPSSFAEYANTDQTQLDRNIMRLLEYGIIRFRGKSSFIFTNTTTSLPRQFCWDKTIDINSEELSKSRIEFNLSYSIPFTHPLRKQLYNHTKIVLISGSNGQGKKLDTYKFISLSKSYYASRHHYQYRVPTSSQYIEYWHEGQFKNISFGYESSYFYGVMSKVIMILDMMYRYRYHEWIVWLDDDEYINPGFLYLPLEAFLKDVPKYKSIVMVNSRSVFTNVILIRNSQRGRKLVRDWLAITQSGFIQCHGFDQAAMAILTLSRIIRDDNFTLSNPLQYSCLYSKQKNILIDEITSIQYELGCNEDKWSCDYDFENLLFTNGFKTKQRSSNEYSLSSFSKGCMNDFVSDFHILTETSELPRLQVGINTRLNEIDAAGHFDGPLGAANDALRPGSVNGWFFNHKAEFLFYESYLNPNKCKQLLFLSNCQIRKKNSLSIISLTDGLAFDYDKGNYCYLTSSKKIQLQKTTTYMRQYNWLINKVNNYTHDVWDESYQSNGNYEHYITGRAPCDKSKASHLEKCPYGTHRIDGQVNRRPSPPFTINMHSEFFEVPNYCKSACKPSSLNLLHHNQTSISIIVDCSFA